MQTNWTLLHGAYFRGKRVLATGGAGFIGSHLVETLCELGASVVVLDDLSGGNVENLAAFAGKGTTPEFVRGSILERELLAECVAGCEVVFHLAALGSVPRSVKEPQLYHDVNTTGTLNVLEAAKRAGGAGVKRVVFSASSSAYGENGVPWVETMAVQARSPYAATKVAGEALLAAYSGAMGLETVSLRYFNIFGPRQNANSAYAAVIAAFAKALLAEEPPVIYGDGTQTRDFTFVHNAVHANLLAAKHPQALGGQVINVGTGKPISVNDLAVRMVELLGKPQLKPRHEAERAGDLLHSYADLQRAAAVLKYAPIVSFDEGLKETVAWYAATSGKN